MASPFAVYVASQLFGDLLKDMDCLRSSIQNCHAAQQPVMAEHHAEDVQELAALVRAQLRIWNDLQPGTKLCLAPNGSEHLVVIEEVREAIRELRTRALALFGGEDNGVLLHRAASANWVQMSKAIPAGHQLLVQQQPWDRPKLVAEKTRSNETLHQERISRANALLDHPERTPEEVVELARNAEEALLIRVRVHLLADADKAIFSRIAQLP